MNKGVKIKSIAIQNLRCYAEKQIIDFSSQDEEGVASCTIILGENGVGKTSVLKALALSLINEEYGYQWKHHIPWDGFDRFNVTDNPSMSYQALIDGEREFSYTARVVKNDLIFSNYDEKAKVEFDQKLVLFAYGAARRIGGDQGLSRKEAGFPALSIFREDVPLANAEEWLIEADNLSLRDEQYKQYRDLVFAAIRQVTQHEVKDIHINIHKRRTVVLFETDYGLVPMHELSLGYKTLLAWTIDFAKGLIERYPDSTHPLAEPAVCLIDEVDLHLHPKLQRDVLDFLQNTFTNTQFIMTAHSPLIVQSARNGNVVLLKKEGDHVVAVNDLDNIRNWRVDQLLTSDLFGLSSGRPKEVEAKMKQRHDLLSKKEFSEEDREQVEALEREMGEIPDWEDMEEKRAFDAIDMIADILKNKNDQDQ